MQCGLGDFTHRIPGQSFDKLQCFGDFVRGHFRTKPNETYADNLSSDVDKDGINGFWDSDADGDGVFESIDINNDGISDYLSIEGENFMEALEFIC